jgi:four helix bundle protein
MERESRFANEIASLILAGMDKYRSLVAWQSAHRFLISTLRATDRQYRPQARALFDQLRRAAVSVEANIVEGYALDTRAQFKRFLRIAKASAAECECLLGAIAELGYLEARDLSALQLELETTMRTLHGLLRKS